MSLFIPNYFKLFYKIRINRVWGTKWSIYTFLAILSSLGALIYADTDTIVFFPDKIHFFPFSAKGLLFLRIHVVFCITNWSFTTDIVRDSFLYTSLYLLLFFLHTSNTTASVINPRYHALLSFWIPQPKNFYVKHTSLYKYVSLNSSVQYQVVYFEFEAL